MAAVSRWLGIAVCGDGVCARDGEQAYCVRLCALWGAFVFHTSRPRVRLLCGHFVCLKSKYRHAFTNSGARFCVSNLRKRVFHIAAASFFGAPGAVFHGTRSLPNAASIAVDLWTC